MHKSGQGFQTADCRVTNKQIVADAGGIVQDQDTLNDIICFLDGGEEDLFRQGVDFKIHASPGMCEYVTYRPYGYYNFPPFQTRETTVYTRYSVLDGEIANCNTWTGAGVGTAPGPNVFIQNGGGHTITQAAPRGNRLWGEIYCERGTCAGGGDNVQDEPRCLGDHSAGLANNNRPNCDEGSYVINTYTCEIPDTAGDCACVMETERTTCNGDIVNCSGGPITETDGLNPNNIDTVQGLIMFSFFGLDGRDVEIPSPESQTGSSSNVFVSNWSSLVETTATGTLRSCVTNGGFNYDADGWEGYNTLVPTGGLTVFGNVPINLLDPTFGFGSKSYEFQCNDSAGDIKARIRVYVRDWNRDFSPTDDIDNLSQGRPGTLLATNKEDTSADSCFGLSCNGIGDWDDLFTWTAPVASRPTFNSCSEHAGQAGATIDITGRQGQRTGECDTAAECINLYPGVIISVDGLAYTVTQASAVTGDFQVTVPFVEEYTTATAATILRNIPFPLEAP